MLTTGMKQYCLCLPILARSQLFAVGYTVLSTTSHHSNNAHRHGPHLSRVLLSLVGWLKLAFHDADTDTDILADILARIVARMSACRSACYGNNFNPACRTCWRGSSRRSRCRCRRRALMLQAYVCLPVCSVGELWSHSATKCGNGHMTV